MRPAPFARLLLTLLVPASLLLTGCGAGRKSATAPLELGMWYWHSPFEIRKEDSELLDELGIGTLYVRAGTFTFKDGHARLILPQSWKSSSEGRKIVAVFNFETDLASMLYKLDLDVLAEDVAAAINDQTSRSKIVFEGAQFDVDCPTSRLKIYASLLKKIRPKIDKKWSLSATGLPSWLSSDDVEAVADAVDFLVPQFYENHFGKTIDDVRPVANLETFEWGLERIGRLKQKMRVGIPSYGHAMLFDEKGKLVSMYRGLSPAKALEHSSLEHVLSRPMNSEGKAAGEKDYVGEDLMIVKAVRADSRGQGLGYRIAFTVPQVQVLSKHLEMLENRPDNVIGAIIYRFPEPGESLTLPLKSVKTGVKKLNADFEWDTKVKVQPEMDDYWVEYAIQVSPSSWNYPSHDSFVLTIDLGGAELEEALADGGRVEWGAGDFTRTSLARAEVVRYSIGHLTADAKHRLQMRVLAPRGAKIEAGTKAISAGSFSTLYSKVEPVTLARRK